MIRPVPPAVLAVLLLVPAAAEADLLTNGDFAAGDLTGWTVFTTANGTNGQAANGDPLPRVSGFETVAGVPSDAAEFRVGQATGGGGGPAAGGGLLQIFSSGAGTLSFSGDVAAFSPAPNAAGGTFEVLLDGQVLDAATFGFLNTNETGRAALAFTAPTAGGQRELRLRLTRPFGVGNASTPTQYLDNLTLTLTPAAVPEPSALALLLLAGLVPAARRLRAGA